MANFLLKKSSSSRPVKNQDGIMTMKTMIKCKKHPKHKQSPGVCSLCLREKLSHATTSTCSSSTSRAATLDSSSSSFSSYYSSSEASSCSSPPTYTKKYNKYNDKQPVSGSLFGGGGGGKIINNVLTKSRSLAFVPRMGNLQQDGYQSKKKKNGGLFSRLLGIRPSNKKIHSRTLGEIIASS